MESNKSTKATSKEHKVLKIPGLRSQIKKASRKKELQGNNQKDGFLQDMEDWEHLYLGHHEDKTNFFIFFFF